LQERFKFSGGDKPIDYSHLGGKEEEEEEEDTPMDLLESGSETDEETRTKHEQQQERLKKHIEQLEAENVGNKKWTLAGEASVKSRPMNSLLEENLQFESASKTVPVITQQVTDTLEDIIKKRIMNADYNDVVRKAPPKEKSFKPKEALLNDEKSKLSLAEVYEQEYQQQMHSLPSATTSALEEQHAQVDKMFRDLMYKLDSLTSHNYIPPPMDVEMRTVANVASVRVEEVMPEAVSTGKRLAPHEVHNVLGERVGGDELSKDEKHTLRLRKKRIAKVKGKNKPVETVTTKTK
jgi:U3 small nucleolar RNA-associated protein MPP10